MSTRVAADAPRDERKGGTSAVGAGVADTPVGGGRPLGAYPNWDAERREFVLHTERDDGSSYDDAPGAEPLPAPEALPAAARRER
jgi:hypothetical protein